MCVYMYMYDTHEGTQSCIIQASALSLPRSILINEGRGYAKTSRKKLNGLAFFTPVLKSQCCLESEQKKADIHM